MKRQVFDSLVITIKHKDWFGDRRILTLNLIWKHHLVNPYAVKEIEFLVNFNNFSFETISGVLMSVVINASNQIMSNLVYQ